MTKKIFIIVTMMALMSCHQNTDEPTTSDFETMTVTASDISFEQTYPAAIEGRQSVKIIPRVEGYLREVRVREGQRVHSGDILFVIDQSSYQAELKVAEANVAVAKAGVDNAKHAYDGRKGLHDKNIVSDFDLQSAANELATAQAHYQQALAGLETARTNLSYTILRSPSDGVVGSLPYRVGDYVSPSMSDGLTVVADNSEMYVYFSLSERDLMSRIDRYGTLDSTVAAIPAVTLVLTDGSRYAEHGRVVSLSGVVESSTGAVSARAVFPNPSGRLLSGGTGSLAIPSELKQSLVIPRSATYEIQDKVFVYKVEGGRARQTIVTIIPIPDGKRCVVSSGLSSGDTIVARGASYVKEGQPINQPRTTKHEE